MADARLSFLARPVSVPVGLVILGATALLGGGSAVAGGVGVATRDGDLAAVRSELATLVDGVKEEQDRRLADHAETERVSLDAVAKRLDRMEDKLDRLLEARR